MDLHSQPRIPTYRGRQCGSIDTGLYLHSPLPTLIIVSQTGTMMTLRRISHSLFSCITVLCLSLCVKAQLLTSTGLTVSLNGTDYFISPYSVGNISVDATALSSSLSIYGFYPVTVVQQDISAADLPAVVQNFTAKDDIFQELFLQGM